MALRSKSATTIRRNKKAPAGVPPASVGVAKSADSPDQNDLGTYAGKRDFTRTSEPPPGAGASAGGAFVVQKHAARRLHFDLRLELDGVLKSWAVTRGPSLTLGEKRLAVRTEDHPIEYLDFEGNIPKGEYGGGSMIVWDRGRWCPEGDAQKGLAKGHLALRLEGDRLKGAWHLVRVKPRRGEKTEPWLLIKADDAFARPPGAPEITDEETTSRISGRTNAQLAAEGTLRVDQADRVAARGRRLILPNVAAIPGARKGLLPAFIEPSLAAPCERPPAGPEWIHEIKHDGYRIQARVDGRSIRLLTRKGLDWTARSVPLFHLRPHVLRGLRPHQSDIAGSQEFAASHHGCAVGRFADPVQRASCNRRPDDARTCVPLRP